MYQPAPATHATAHDPLFLSLALLLVAAAVIVATTTGYDFVAIVVYVAVAALILLGEDHVKRHLTGDPPDEHL